MMRSYFPGGSILNGSVAFLPDLSPAEGTALSLDNGAPVAATSVERADLKRGETLSLLCDEWVRSLPKRTGADGQVDGQIPVKSQRPKKPGEPAEKQ